LLVFLIFALITSLAGYLMASIPQITFIVAIIWGAALIVSGRYLSRGLMLILYIINILLLYGVAGGSTLFFYLTFFGLSAFVMSFMVGFKKNYYKLQKWGFIAAALGVSIFLGSAYITSGGIGINEVETELNNLLEEAMQKYEDSNLLKVYEEQGISRAELEKRLADFSSTLARHLPAFYYLQAFSVVFFMLFLASYVSVKYKLKYLSKKPFDQEIMPWQLTWIFILGLILWLWDRENMSFMFYIGSNILTVLVPITIYFGLSIVTYKLKQQEEEKRKWLVTVLLVLTVIFPLVMLIFLSLLGLFDSLLDYRKLQAE